MASSSGDDVPHGLEFLLSRNRLNVAISRARCLAYLVASPRLLEVNCRTIEQMRLANALCRFVELAPVTVTLRRFSREVALGGTLELMRLRGELPVARHPRPRGAASAVLRRAQHVRQRAVLGRHQLVLRPAGGFLHRDQVVEGGEPDLEAGDARQVAAALGVAA